MANKFIQHVQQSVNHLLSNPIMPGDSPEVARMKLEQGQAGGELRHESLGKGIAGQAGQLASDPRTWAVAAAPFVLPAVGSAIGGAGAAGAAGAAGKAASVGGALKSIGGVIKDVAPIAIGGMSAYEGIQQNRRANDLQDRAIGMAEENAAARKPLLSLGMAGMQNAKRPDLSEQFTDDGNVYARQRRKLPSVGGY